MSSARAPVDARAGVETSKDDAHVSAVVRTDDDDDGFRDDAATPAVTQARAAHHGRALRTASANGRTVDDGTETTTERTRAVGDDGRPEDDADANAESGERRRRAGRVQHRETSVDERV